MGASIVAMAIRVAGARLVLREARVAAATWMVARENREVRIIGFIAGKSDEENAAMRYPVASAELVHTRDVRRPRIWLSLQPATVEGGG